MRVEGVGGDTLPQAACMRVEEGALNPRVDCPTTPLLTMFIGTRYEKLFPVSSWRAFRNFKWPGTSQSLWSLHKNESMHEGWGGGTWPQGRLSPPPPLLTMFIGTRYEKLFPASSWRAFRNFKWPGSSQSLWSLHKNESMHEGWGGGCTLPQGRLSHHLPMLTMFIATRYEKLFPASSWRAFRNFKWPGSSQSLWSLHKNESMHEGWGGGHFTPG